MNSLYNILRQTLPLWAVSLLIAGCVSRPFIFRKNPDMRLPQMAGGRVVSAMNGARTVHGYFVHRSQKLVVLFHGQAMTMVRETQFAQVFAGAGFSVLMVEYAGYGLSKKESPSESALYQDSEVLLDNVAKDHGFVKDDIVFWGRSLGSGVAAELLKRQKGRAAILVTPYTSIAAVAEHKSIPLLPRLFVWDNFNTASKAEDIAGPVLLIGAGKDTVTPVKMTHELAQKFPAAQTIILPRSGHTAVFSHLTEQHWQQILRFAGG